MNKYKVAGYLRISKEENEQTNSIANQKEIINAYIKNNEDFELVDYYIDDGYSGTDFNRTGFKSLLEDIKNKKVDTIIVKDLSRFGRNYIEVGNYIENIFPLLNVRFISINDSFDSSNDSYYIEDIIPLKNMTNDFYAKDISKKVKTALRTKKINGKFVGKSAPYYYLKDPKDIHKFIIDKEAAMVVKKIFDLTLKGRTRGEIAEELNVLEKLPPALYKVKNGISNYKVDNTNRYWNSAIINRIIKDENYTGVLIQGKTRRLNYRIHKRIDVDSDDWIKLANHHEAIISESDFEKVQHILKNKLNRANMYGKSPMLSGYLKCADCGQSLIIKKGKNKEYDYCSSYVKKKICTKHSMQKNVLEDKILNDIKNNSTKYKNAKLLIKKMLLEVVDKILVFEDSNICVNYKD